MRGAEHVLTVVRAVAEKNGLKMKIYDVIVVGGGIAGASVAYALSRDGRVLLLEHEHQAGYHSTSRSAAVVSSAYGPRTWQLLTAASASFYATPPEGFASAKLTKQLGALYLARAGEEGELEDQAADLERRGLACALITPSSARELVPCVTNNGPIGAAYFGVVALC